MDLIDDLNKKFDLIFKLFDAHKKLIEYSIEENKKTRNYLIQTLEYLEEKEKILSVSIKAYDEDV